jgi:hypothetical protein
MFEADIHLRPLHTSVLDICKKVFEPVACCLKGKWVHPYTIPPAKLAPDMVIFLHVWSEIDIWVHPYTFTPAKLAPDLEIQVHL